MGSRWRERLLRSMDTRTSARYLASLMSWRGVQGEGRKHDYLVLLHNRYLFIRLFRNCIHCLYWRILMVFPSHSLFITNGVNSNGSTFPFTKEHPLSQRLY